jgi:hypothetical protein
MGSERICVCGKTVSSMRRSDWCSSTCKRQHDYENRKEKLKGSKTTTFVLVHACIRPELQMGETPDPLTCGCRKEMSAEDLKARIGHGEIVLVGSEGHACYSSKQQKAPRAQTVEKAHIERANLSADSGKYNSKAWEQLRAKAEEDKASRALEEKCRIEVFHEIEIEERRRLVKEIPAEAYDRISGDQWGRQWLGQPGNADQRTEGGVGIEVLTKGDSEMRCATCNADLEKEECSHVRGDVRAPSSGALAQIRQQLLSQPQPAALPASLVPNHPPAPGGSR